MFGMFGPKTKEEAIKKILYYQSQPILYSGVVPYEKEINQLKDKFKIDDGEIEIARKKMREKEDDERRKRNKEEEERSQFGGKKSRKSRKMRKSKKSRKMKKSRKSRKMRKSRKSRKMRKSRKSRKMKGKGCGCGRVNCPYCRGRRTCACPYRK